MLHEVIDLLHVTYFRINDTILAAIVIILRANINLQSVLNIVKYRQVVVEADLSQRLLDVFGVLQLCQFYDLFSVVEDLIPVLLGYGSLLERAHRACAGALAAMKI